MKNKTNKGFSKKLRNQLKNVDIASIYKGFKNDIALDGVLYLDPQGNCISADFTETKDKLKPLVIQDILDLTAQGKRVNVLKIVVSDKTIISSDLIIDLQMKPKDPVKVIPPEPTGEKTITVAFTALIEEGTAEEQLAKKMTDQGVPFTPCENTSYDAKSVRESAEQVAKDTLAKMNKTIH